MNNITIETKVKKGKNQEVLAVSLNPAEVTKIAATRGLEAANKAIDKFVSKYTLDLKKKISEILNSKA